MRYVYMALVAVLVTVVVVFAVQNLQMVTLSLISMKATLPVSLLVILVYVLGMLTGGSVSMMLRTWVRGAKGKGRAGGNAT